MKYWLILFCMGLFIFLTSCEIDPNRKRKAKQKLIEKLVNEKTDSLKMDLDSICVIRKEVEFDDLVDSIIDVRLVDIRRKMKQNGK